MSLALRETSDGVVIPVRVVPRSGRTALDGAVEGALRVRLAAPPVEGAANRELCEFLARVLDVPRRDVEIVSGAQSRRKSVLVRRLALSDAVARLGVE